MGEVTSIDRLWSVPVKTLYQWKWRREGPPVRKVGRHLRYDPAAVKSWATKAA